MSEELYPPAEGWFVQRQLDDESWAPYAPTTTRSKALERLASSRLAWPGYQHRIVKETRTYTLDNEDES